MYLLINLDMADALEFILKAVFFGKNFKFTLDIWDFLRIFYYMLIARNKICTLPPPLVENF